MTDDLAEMNFEKKKRIFCFLKQCDSKQNS